MSLRSHVNHSHGSSYGMSQVGSELRAPSTVQQWAQQDTALRLNQVSDGLEINFFNLHAFFVNRIEGQCGMHLHVDFFIGTKD